MSLEFSPFQKINRLKRDCTITEKIDGSNGLIAFDERGNILVGSRKREIFPEGTPGLEKGCDNFGFAGWAYENKDTLFSYLGKGFHYGEWAGGSIQRGYHQDKRFYVFNTFRHDDIPAELLGIGLRRVPILFQGEFDTASVNMIMYGLAQGGSHLNPATRPEGVVVYHHALKQYFKVTYEHDVTGKPT